MTAYLIGIGGTGGISYSSSSTAALNSKYLDIAKSVPNPITRVTSNYS